MPELPEVQTIVQGLQKLINHEITYIKIYSTKLRYTIPKKITKVAHKVKIIQIYRISKYIIINLNNSFSIIIHLGMSGRLILYKNNNVDKKKHDHLIIKTKKYKLIYNDVRKFGFIDYSLTKKVIYKKYIKTLGIDALDLNLNENYLYKKISKSHSSIKQILLNQKIISGIGNIYACEILFDAKISPFRRGCNLQFKEYSQLLKSIRKILRKAINHGGSTLRDYVAADGTLGNFQNNFKVYQKEGKKILGFEIIRKIQSGRSTYYCPKIQIIGNN